MKELYTYGYARVSTQDQNLDRQIDALCAFGVDPCNIFSDKVSGKNFKRPSYCKLMERLCSGDVLVIKSIDRLGRNYGEILEQWRNITKRKRAAVVVLDMPLLDTRTAYNGVTGEFIADITLQLLAYVAQVERENTKQRQAEGIASARARGVRFGRPKIARPPDYLDAANAYVRGEITQKQAADMLDVSIATFNRWREADGIVRPEGQRSKHHTLFAVRG